jgi:N,N'-diacetyllegionaminate synthase
VKIANRTIDRDSKPYIIAEIGVNHDGCLEVAQALIEKAALAGADAVKFQIFDAQTLLSSAAGLTEGQIQSGEQNAQEMLQRLSLSFTDLDKAIHTAHDLNVHAIASVFSMQLVDLSAQQDWDAFKIASPDLINHPLITSLTLTGRPLIVSTGASTMEEVHAAAKLIGVHPYIFMHCVSAYPTPDEQAHLGGIIALAEGNDQAIGYSDHTTSLDTGGLAIAAGASVLEKHLTHDQLAGGPDHAMSLDASALQTYISLAHRAYGMLGNRIKEPGTIELEVRSLTRQSLTSTRSLLQGTILQADDLTLKRPGIGLPPSALKQTIGRQLAVDLKADMPIQASDLA